MWANNFNDHINIDHVLSSNLQIQKPSICYRKQGLQKWKQDFSHYSCQVVTRTTIVLSILIIAYRTNNPLKVIRAKDSKCLGWDNKYIIGNLLRFKTKRTYIDKKLNLNSAFQQR